MSLSCVSPREKELANDVLCRWSRAGTETLPEPVHRCLILFLLTSQWQADSGKMDHSDCGETEFLCLLGIQLHHMFSVSPKPRPQSLTEPSTAGREGWSCTSLCSSAPHPSQGPVDLCQSLWQLSWLFVLSQTPVAFVVACIPSRKHSPQQMLANAGSVGEILVKSRFQCFFKYTSTPGAMWGLSKEVYRIGKLFKFYLKLTVNFLWEKEGSNTVCPQAQHRKCKACPDGQLRKRVGASLD